MYAMQTHFPAANSASPLSATFINQPWSPGISSFIVSPTTMQLKELPKKVHRLIQIYHFEVVPCATMSSWETVVVDLAAGILIVVLFYLFASLAPVAKNAGSLVYSAASHYISA